MAAWSRRLRPKLAYGLGAEQRSLPPPAVAAGRHHGMSRSCSGRRSIRSAGRKWRCGRPCPAGPASSRRRNGSTCRCWRPGRVGSLRGAGVASDGPGRRCADRAVPRRIAIRCIANSWNGGPAAPRPAPTGDAAGRSRGLKKDGPLRRAVLLFWDFRALSSEARRISPTSIESCGYNYWRRFIRGLRTRFMTMCCSVAGKTHNRIGASCATSEADTNQSNRGHNQRVKWGRWRCLRP